MDHNNSLRKTFFVDSGRRNGKKVNTIRLPPHPYHLQLNREEYIQKGNYRFSKLNPYMLNLSSTYSSSSDSPDPTGVYYTGSACDYSGQSDENKGKMNTLQSDINALNSKIQADFTVAMDDCIQKGYTVFNYNGVRYDAISGSTEEDTRKKNTYLLWKGCFEDTQEELQSYYIIGQEHDSRTENWKGGAGFNDTFVNSTLSRFYKDYSDDVVSAISDKFRKAQETDMAVAQEENNIDYFNTLLTTVIFLDADGNLQATNSVTEYYMSQRETQKLDCKNPVAEGTVTYSFQGSMYRMDVELLREQVGDNWNAIQSGNQFFFSLSDSGQADIVADDDAEPVFF